jgi:large subunit ribosomal protein L15
MINLSNIPKIVQKKRKRIGKGEGSNRGKNAGKGHKGQTKHGGKVPIWFEGGQKSLSRRSPKFKGFKARENYFRVTLPISVFNVFAENETINLASLLEKGIITDSIKEVRVIKTGEIDHKLTFDSTIYLTKGVKEMLNS